MPITNFPIPSLPLTLIPSAPSFSPGAHLVTIQDGAEKKIPIEALPGAGFDVTAYGASKAGVIECSSQIQDAINACSGAGGGTVFFPAGMYLTDTPLSVPSNVRLLGDSATIFSSAPSDGAKLAINGSNITIEGLTLDGAKVSTSGSGFFEFGLIDIVRDDATSFSGITIIGCIIRRSEGCGIRVVGNVDGLLVFRNRFSGNFIDIFAEKATTRIFKNVAIRSNDFGPTWYTGTFSAAVKMKGDIDAGIFATHVDVTDNIIRNSAEMGVELFGGFKDSSVVNNHIVGPIFGVSINNGINITVALNKIYRCSYVGIEIAENSSFCLTIGNTVEQYTSGTTRGGDAGIITSGTFGCHDNLFINNTVRGTNKAIDCQNNLRTVIKDNHLWDSTVALQIKASSYITAADNHLHAGTGAAPSEFHIFIDFTNKDCTDIDLVRNHLYGYANNDNLITYRGATSWRLFNLRVAYNNLTAASYGNVSFNGGGVPNADRPNLQCYDNHTLTRSQLTGVTGADAGDLMTKPDHALDTGFPVRYVSGSGFTGLVANTRYFAIPLTSSTFKLATSYANAVGGTAVTLSADGTSGIFDPSVGQANWPDFTTNAAAIPPFAASIQAGGISVAGKTTVTAPAAGAARWVKVFSHDFGLSLLLQCHFLAINTTNGDSSAINAIVAAAPFDLNSSVTILPSPFFSGIIDEIIYNNSGSAIQEVWLKLKSSDKNYTISCHFSEHAQAVVGLPTLTATQPTWGTNHYRAAVGELAQTHVFQASGVHAAKHLSSAARGAIDVLRGRLHIKGVGVTGGTSQDRIATFETDAGAEAVGVRDDGALLVQRNFLLGGGPPVKALVRGLAVLSYGTVNADSESTVTLYVANARTAGTPSVHLGWDGPLPAGIVLKQVRVSADDEISITLRNTTGGNISVGDLGTSATVLQFP
jgi:hypothetical protein